MSSSNALRFTVLLALASVTAIGLTMSACSSDQKNTGDASADSSPTGDGSGGDAADSGDSGPALKPAGCFAGKPAQTADFMNACTTADFVVFDNCARLGVCGSAALPALVTPPAPPAPDAGDAGADASDGGDSG